MHLVFRSQTPRLVFTSIGASLVFGGAAGCLTALSAKPRTGETELLASSGHGPAGAGLPGRSLGGGSPVSERDALTDFGSFEFQKQREILLRFGASGSGMSASEELLLERMIRQLTADQSAALLEGAGLEGKPWELSVRSAIARRLAAHDSQRALEMAKGLSDSALFRAALDVIAQGSAAEAIREIAGLSPEAREKLLGFHYPDPSVRSGGSLEELSKALVESNLIRVLTNGTEGPARNFVHGLLTRSLASTLLANPAKGPDTWSQLVETLQQGKRMENGGAVSREDAEAVLGSVLDDALMELRATDSGASSRFLHSPRGQAIVGNTTLKSYSQVEEYDRFRLRRGAGGETESRAQNSPEILSKYSAAQFWLALSQEDSPAAFRWIESLPAGQVRDGALRAVYFSTMNSKHHNYYLFDPFQVAENLRSTELKLDYFTEIYEISRGFGYSAVDFTSRCPISDFDKRELQRRLAPLKTP